ncbi:hypothetical protein CTI12_AA416100 [Artemisia annua]|uniref:BUD13-like protein n=1 Tax=Artemisia annua TaxID=35608 RepID=A0A2U1M4N6_ARTAN|nr:hypothetical protein CTI12_AA416100 [Artemisia annua]
MKPFASPLRMNDIESNSGTEDQNTVKISLPMIGHALNVDSAPKEIKVEWGKGLAQKREAEARLEELGLQKTKPFARTRDDPDLENMLKERVRWGDPMTHFVKRKDSELVLSDIGDNEKMKESGFIVPQEAPKHSWLKRGLDAAPNRHGIRPGRHWDGVDRSNDNNLLEMIVDKLSPSDLKKKCSVGKMRNKLQNKKLTCGQYLICEVLQNRNFVFLLQMRNKLQNKKHT